MLNEGYGSKIISKKIGISVDHTKQQIRRIKNKKEATGGGNKNDPKYLRRNTSVQKSSICWETTKEIAGIMEDVPTTRMSVGEYQVLQLAGNGMTVKAVAGRIGKSENAIRQILKRRNVSVCDYKKIDIKNIVIPDVLSPLEKEKTFIADATNVRIARFYFSNYNEPVSEEKVLAEISLRAAGKILRTPAIFKRNAETLKRLLALSSGKKVVCMTPEQKRDVAEEIEHYRPQRLYVNIDCVVDDAGKVKKTEYLAMESGAWQYFQQAFAASNVKD
ncbi:MAG: hypothetical protein C4542_02240 [Dehalococcoidia bacterium]|nr:MAG: hypothetical protein C4542_02240 [Dehalococcoidia bacterium]